MRGRLAIPGWTLLLVLSSSAGTALAQDEGPLPEGPAAVAPDPQPVDSDDTPGEVPTSSKVLPNYVVWRIKPGTGAGALAPRLERRLRKEMEAKLGGLMLSKAAQTGIILIRPELADCDANMPCALDVAEALNIRFVVGGEAETTASASITGWIVDKEHGAEIRRVTVPIQGSGEEAETAAVVGLRDALLTPPRVAQVDKEKEAPPAPAAAGPSRGPWLGGSLLAGAGGLAVLSVGALLVGGAAMASAGVFLWARSAYHTRSAFTGMLGTAAAGGSLLVVAAVLLVLATPVAGLGGLALLMRGP